MEVCWYHINLKEPTIHKPYWTTVYNNYWDKPKAMLLNWDEEVYRGIKRGIWKDRGNKIPSTWEVVYWMELPEAKED